eukprot:Ihof_evm2s775 gene=Ihof_evmTU2s775
MEKKDVLLDGQVSPLVLDKHVQYIATYGKNESDFDYHMSEHLRMNGMYWGLTAMELLGKLDLMDKPAIIDFVLKCQHPEGGFGASIGHDAHILSTLSAVQIMVLYGEEDQLDAARIAKWVGGLQQEDGSFAGDIWGEIDTRFSFCALATFSLLNMLKEAPSGQASATGLTCPYGDIDKAISFITRCMNFDGGFGCTPGSESHAGQIFCCVGALAIANSIHLVNADELGWWLAERQLPSGGLNGRPEKLPDVCYSWWVLSSMMVLERLHWIDKDKLTSFILTCQDTETGGFADRPGDMVDPFHTLFGLA